MVIKTSFCCTFEHYRQTSISNLSDAVPPVFWRLKKTAQPTKPSGKIQNIATMSAPSYWFQHGRTTAVLAYSDGQLFSTPFIEIKIPCHNSICGVKHRQDVINMEAISVYNLLAAALTAPASFLVKSWAFSGKPNPLCYTSPIGQPFTCVGKRKSRRFRNIATENDMAMFAY